MCANSILYTHQNTHERTKHTYKLNSLRLLFYEGSIHGRISYNSKAVAITEFECVEGAGNPHNDSYHRVHSEYVGQVLQLVITEKSKQQVFSNLL